MSVASKVGGGDVGRLLGGDGQASVPAGEVTFVVRNDEKIPHEFVVVRSDREPLKLPTKFKKEIDASMVRVLGKIDEFDGCEDDREDVTPRTR